MVAPTLAFGFSEHHMDFPGTLTLSIPTYIAAVTEVCESLVRHGCRKLLLLNGHGGNHELAQVVVRQMVARHELVIGAASYWDVALPALRRIGAEALGLIPGHSAGLRDGLHVGAAPRSGGARCHAGGGPVGAGPDDIRQTLARHGSDVGAAQRPAR